MSFSINPLEFLKLMSERRKMSREQVVEWLEAVQADGRLLSTTWMALAGKLDHEPESDTEEQRLAREMKEALGKQAVVCSRLGEFFQHSSLAVAGRLDTLYWNEFIKRLGGTVHHRHMARRDTEKFIKLRSEGRMLLDSRVDRERVRTVEEAIAALQTELAALDVIIQTIKAAPNAIR